MLRRYLYTILTEVHFGRCHWHLQVPMYLFVRFPYLAKINFGFICSGPFSVTHSHTFQGPSLRRQVPCLFLFDFQVLSPITELSARCQPIFSH